LRPTKAINVFSAWTTRFDEKAPLLRDELALGGTFSSTLCEPAIALAPRAARELQRTPRSRWTATRGSRTGSAAEIAQLLRVSIETGRRA
jgi:hypothetical protein